ncbi:hypothetical protein QR98_0013570 [Sarcoptes scabiei]|uniref:Uncharacterized protein n=1 Tax=Sarcoptes scabiei TaxID=52283 RepID=A0A131ZW98_SARSC|nr:hypothetical protein QR98_0013570 [Sarcoptes scabiei]
MEDNVSSDRKDNLGDSDHGESNDRDDDQINLRQHQHQHQQQQQYQQQSENSRTKSIVDDNRPSVPSKPPILPRQTSTMTPVTASKPIQLPASNKKFVLNAVVN